MFGEGDDDEGVMFDDFADDKDIDSDDADVSNVYIYQLWLYYEWDVGALYHVFNTTIVNHTHALWQAKSNDCISLLFQDL